MDSLKDLAFLDDGDVENLGKCANRHDGTTTTGTGASSVVYANMGFIVSIRAEANLKLCVFYLNHQMMTFPRSGS
jgi:hypothetical protein